jgi:hypothetical protein
VARKFPIEDEEVAGTRYDWEALESAPGSDYILRAFRLEGILAFPWLYAFPFLGWKMEGGGHSNV